MEQNFLQKSRTKANELLDDTINYLVKRYKQSKEVFTYSTAYGQILLTIQNLYQFVLFFIQDVASEQNIATAQRPHSVYGITGLTGHNPSRGRSATGEISLSRSVNAKDTLPSSQIYISNYTRIRCLNNQLEYLIDLGADDALIDINNLSNQRFRIIEGQIESQLFTGTGENLQTFQINMSSNKYITDDYVIVSVDEQKYNQYVHLYDIPFKDKGCIVRTGLTSGLNIMFGNRINCTIPELGQRGRVDYIITSGASGNLDTKNGVAFEFIDTGFDINGEEVDLNAFISINTEIQPMLGSDHENMELTKALAPNISRNFVIHDEKSIRYFLAKMNFFSTIKVQLESTDNQNTYNLLLLPNVQNKMIMGEDYFSLDVNKFLLSDDEQTRLFNMIDESGMKSGSITLKYQEPIIKKFVLVLILDVFEKSNGMIVRKEVVSRDIRTALSDYMSNNKRVNKVPHSDIVRIIDEISYIDTVKAVFLPLDQADIDDMGNITVGEDEIAMMRGGWTSEDGTQFLDDFDPEGQLMGSVNLDIRFVKPIQ